MHTYIYIHTYMHTYNCVLETIFDLTYIHDRFFCMTDSFAVISTQVIITTSTAVTILSTPRAIMTTKTMSLNSSPEQPSGQQSEGSSDSIWIIWMSLSIVFVLLTIVAVAVSIGCVLKKKSKFKINSHDDNVTLAHTNSLRK